MKKKLYRFSFTRKNIFGYHTLWDSLHKHLRSKYECDKRIEILENETGSRFVISVWATKSELEYLLSFCRRMEEALYKKCAFKWAYSEVKNTKMYTRYFIAWF